ncbi:hypothetical protein [Streptomyces sp. NPDC021622]|uniref:HoxN/HupN/NixA family nickel/cobalt transporter n=1 Tax=Streptomyces sp. NPDC021622 TaxID=3155013 RepID=UPI0033C3A3EA
MRTLLTGVLLVLAAVPALLFGSAGTAQAHPFGTPPVVKVEARESAVDVNWSAQPDDMAVLADKSGGDEAGYLGSHIRVRQDGANCPVEQASGTRLRFACPRPVDRITLTVTALTDVDRAYRTVSVTPRGGGGLHTARAPARTLTLTSSGAPAGPASSGSAWTTDLTAVLDHGVFLPLALLVSMAVGALHACAPGHGKSLAAGYLVGGRGRARDAVWLGAIVALMHTLSVTALAVGWWLAAESTPDIASLTGWLNLAAALVVVGVGVALLVRLSGSRAPKGRGELRAQPQWRRRHHDDDHDHGHHDHSHTHHIPTAPSLLTWRGLLLLGTSGGLLPSPSAFLVLLTGLLTGRTGTALAMVGAFGAGMALTLAGVGLAVLKGRDALLTRASGSARLRVWALRVPVVAASSVVAGGTVASVLAAGRVLAP